MASVFSPSTLYPSWWWLAWRNSAGIKRNAHVTGGRPPLYVALLLRGCMTAPAAASVTLNVHHNDVYPDRCAGYVEINALCVYWRA